MLKVQRVLKVELRKKSVKNKVENVAKTIKHFKNLLYCIALDYDKRYTDILNYFTNTNFLEKFCKGREHLPKEANSIRSLKKQLRTIWSEQLSSDVVKMIAKTTAAEFKSVLGKRKAGLNAPLPKPIKLDKLRSFVIDSNPNMVRDKRFLKRSHSYHVCVNLGRMYGNVKIKLPQGFAAPEVTNVKIMWDVIGNITALVTYTKLVRRNRRLNRDYFASIDIGVNNLLTVLSNKPGLRSFIINGKPAKSFNQWVNKLAGKLQADDEKLLRRYLWKYRNKRLTHYLHAVSNKIVDILLKSRIGVLVIPTSLMSVHHSKSKSSKRFNQIFRQIPFGKLISMLKYKCKEVGIRVLATEESYTSKTSSASGYMNRRIFNGTRVSRGLFKDHKINKVFNADLNGALNIAVKAMRRIVRFRFLKLPNWLDKLCRPIKITIPC